MRLTMFTSVVLIVLSLINGTWLAQADARSPRPNILFVLIDDMGYRDLKAEYGADSRLESAPWELLRWVPPTTDVEKLVGILPTGGKVAVDPQGEPAILFPTEWALRFFVKHHGGYRAL